MFISSNWRFITHRTPKDNNKFIGEFQHSVHCCVTFYWEITDAIFSWINLTVVFLINRKTPAFWKISVICGWNFAILKAYRKCSEAVNNKLTTFEPFPNIRWMIWVLRCPMVFEASVDTINRNPDSNYYMDSPAPGIHLYVYPLLIRGWFMTLFFTTGKLILTRPHLSFSL